MNVLSCNSEVIAVGAIAVVVMGEHCGRRCLIRELRPETNEAIVTFHDRAGQTLLKGHQLSVSNRARNAARRGR